jgi:hypothetical protein
VDLPAERIFHAVHQVRLLSEVGHDRGDVVQTIQAQERCATFEVDQHEIEVLRWVAADHPEHHGPEQLGFSGAGGTDTQPVWSQPALRRLFDVELDESALRRGSDGHPKPVAAAASGPSSRTRDAHSSAPSLQ